MIELEFLLSGGLMFVGGLLSQLHDSFLNPKKN